MSTKITIVGAEMVKPAGAAAYEGPLYMTAWDQIFGVLHAKTVHFYNEPTLAQQNRPMIETLKGSLGLALAQFSPLAGRLRWVGAGHWLEIDCNGMGAELVEAECDEEMRLFRGLESWRLKLLVPAVDYERLVDEAPLLLVQLTRFRCGGVSIGISTSHAVVDGQSAFHFFAEWTRLALGEPMKEAPCHDRTIFRAIERPNKGGQPSFSEHIELGKQDNIEERRKETEKVVLQLTKAQLDKLKLVAASAENDNGSGVPRFSRYEVIAAHIWRCACKARGHKSEQPTAVSIAVDVRNRIHTIQLPQRYFGNTILVMRATSRAGELTSNPLGFACGKLREAINKVDEDYIWSNIELLEKREDLSFYGQDIRVSKIANASKPFHGNPNLRVISWLTLPIHDMDFGWGNKIDMIPIARDLDGSSVLLPGSGNDGSVKVVLCLQVAHLDDFKKHFYEDIHDIDILSTFSSQAPRILEERSECYHRNARCSDLLRIESSK